ncbi:MAG: phosphatidate cytidylyltransferase, partial [Bacilli bacterium]
IQALYQKRDFPFNDIGFTILGILYVGFPFYCFTRLGYIGGSFNHFLPLGFMILLWTSDTGAYLAGRSLGKHKLFERISPNKTWEGFIGGVLFSTFICTCFYVTAFDYSSNIIVLIAVVSALSIISQLGDLVCSCIKRYYKVKDFSNIMPGHGGIIDRLDSILFVMLAFSFLMSFI